VATTYTKSEDGTLPPDLDFFKYTQGGQRKRKGSPGNDARDAYRDVDGREGKRCKLVETTDLEGGCDNGGEDLPAAAPPIPRCRVTTKGSNIPEHIKTFEDLRQRYVISSHVFSNLSRNGYHRPTSIQSYGIPILMEANILLDKFFMGLTHYPVS
jgi:ATP-dependent RNA helicase DDX52/ROK1